ncbi:hypothetical protein B0H19DRAFT_1265023 [Mycena capillaripes]|nr:hypothetical protein B0H19DRAFT_1265023 [Mycena capillaripes]
MERRKVHVSFTSPSVLGILNVFPRQNDLAPRRPLLHRDPKRGLFLTDTHGMEFVNSKLRKHGNAQTLIGATIAALKGGVTEIGWGSINAPSGELDDFGPARKATMDYIAV